MKPFVVLVEDGADSGTVVAKLRKVDGRAKQSWRRRSGARAPTA